jgi:methionyl-tRNA formyltransferase
VIASGARVSGATVHFIDEEFDRGAIAAQWPVPVYPSDEPDDVAARVLRVEHLLLPLVTEAVAAGTLTLDADGRVRGHLGRQSASAAARAERFHLAAIAAADSDDSLPEADDASTVAQAAFSYDVARLFPH